ncbi:MAG: TIGR01777 family oxidoreductase [Chlamydiia bacterium]
MTGASGWIGRAFQVAAYQRGWTVTPIVRSPIPGAILWDAKTQFAAPEELEGFDAILHLAGESIFGIWTPGKRQRIFDSRVQSTDLLSRALAACRKPPSVLISASAVGYYGDTGEERVNAEHTSGRTFLAHVCQAWEAAAEPAAQAGIRVCHPRFGTVLGFDGGALQTMTGLARCGLGAVLGSGEQWWAWISIEDLVEALCWAIETASVRGSWNLVSPEPKRQADFAKELAAALHRPCVWRIPGRVIRLAADGLADSLLLCSCRAEPDPMLLRGFKWKFPTLEKVLATRK